MCVCAGWYGNRADSSNYFVGILKRTLKQKVGGIPLTHSLSRVSAAK